MNLEKKARFLICIGWCLFSQIKWIEEEGAFFYIYNLHVFKQKIYTHQVLIYLNVPGIPVKKPLQNSKIVEEQLNV